MLPMVGSAGSAEAPYLRSVCGCMPSSSAAMLMKNRSSRVHGCRRLCCVDPSMRLIRCVSGNQSIWLRLAVGAVAASAGADSGRGQRRGGRHGFRGICKCSWRPAPDFVTIGLLVLSRACLSADNPGPGHLVLGLPPASRRRPALRILGAFAFRPWPRARRLPHRCRMGEADGAAYLLYLPTRTPRTTADGEKRTFKRPGRGSA